MITVRPIRRDDIKEAIELLIGGTLTPGSEDDSRESEYWAAAEGCQENGGIVLVAEDDGEVVGVCQVLILWHFQRSGGKAAEIESVHVRADRRSQGIGALMIGAAEEHATAHGCYRIQLTSNNQRLDAHRFYLRLGYDQSHQGFKKLLPR